MIRKQLTTKEITEKKSKIEYLLRSILRDRKDENSKWEYASINKLGTLLNSSHHAMLFIESSEKYGVDTVIKQLVIY